MIVGSRIVYTGNRQLIILDARIIIWRIQNSCSKKLQPIQLAEFDFIV